MKNLENIHNIADTGAMPPEEISAAETAQPADQPTAEDQAVSPSDISRMIEEAEQRGYLRGRNEKITETVMSPDNSQPEACEEDCEDSCPSFLAHIRPGFWEQ